MILLLAAPLAVLVLPVMMLIISVLADLAGEAEWRNVQRAWDAYSPTVTGALHREVMDRSQHLL